MKPSCEHDISHPYTRTRQGPCDMEVLQEGIHLGGPGCRIHGQLLPQHGLVYQMSGHEYGFMLRREHLVNERRNIPVREDLTITFKVE